MENQKREQQKQELLKDFPGQVTELGNTNIVISSIDAVINWSRANSLWPLTFGTSCCAIEMMQVLHRFVDQDWSIHDIVADGFDEPMVRRVACLVLQNEYKRRQGAPGTRVTSRGFGRDRRYPITSGWRESSVISDW